MHDLPKHLRLRWTETPSQPPKPARPVKPRIRSWHASDVQTAEKRQASRQGTREERKRWFE